MANESRVTIDKIQFPSSTLGASAASQAQALGGVTQAKPVEGLASVLGVDIEIVSGKNIHYNDMIQFLQKIESNRRSMQVKKIVVQPDLEKNVLSFEVTVTIFVKP